ncbi:MAG: phosphatidate cytidylyltransferase [Hydrogenothermaceae bacterium]|nr:phosphatidate cytidylyltransferase [Hydrogenothermaceae bacterium]
MSELVKRTLSGVVLAFAVILSIIYLPVEVLKVSVCLLSVVVVYELIGLLEDILKGFRNVYILLMAFLSSLSLLFLDVYLAVLLIALYGFWIGHRYNSLQYTSFTFLTLVYGVFFVSSIGKLIEEDKLLVFLLFSVVWVGDTTAYIVGKNFGKHKMAPALSPKKTWEGGFGSFLGSFIAGYSFIDYFNLSLVYMVPVLISAVFLQVGDLFESFIKRQVGKKDASNLIPGHGGLLDRVDSLVFASVVFLVWIDLSKLV